MKTVKNVLIALLAICLLPNCSHKTTTTVTTETTPSEEDPLSLWDIIDEEDGRTRLLTDVELKTLHVYNSREIKMTWEDKENSSQVVDGKIVKKKKPEAEIIYIRKGTIGSIKKIYGTNKFLVSFSKEKKMCKFYFHLVKGNGKGNYHYYLKPTEGDMEYPELGKKYHISTNAKCKLLRSSEEDNTTTRSSDEAEGDDGN